MRSLGFVALLAWGPAAGRIQAQDAAVVTLSAATLADGIDLGDVAWRYHPGDDPAWADPAFDDGRWTLRRSGFGLDTLAALPWTGIGWFRLHLVPDDAVQGEPLALMLAHFGASEVYLNGRLIQRYGRVSDDPASFAPFYPASIPLVLDLDGRSRHLLAIRYSFPEARSWLLRYGGWQLEPTLVGFTATLRAPQAALEAAARVTGPGAFTGLFIGVLILMALLHLLLYLFDRRDRAQLYLALFAVVLAAHLCLFQYLHVLKGTSVAALLFLNAVAFIGGGLAQPLVLLLLCMLFLGRVPRWAWGLIGVFALAMAAKFLFSDGISFTVVSFAFLFINLALTGWALWRRKSGARITGLASILLLVGFALIVLFSDRPDRVGLFVFGLAIFFMSMPAAMSFLLARRFVRTNQRLERELATVQALSEQTLVQEREKQQLIATRNEWLEQQVAERTVALEASLDDLKATQQQLIHAEKMASLGALTAGIAHEIKNPLNFINNFAEINTDLTHELREALQRGEGPEDVLEQLERNGAIIVKHGLRADGIVQAMMQHASGGTGVREPTDINQLVAEYIGLAFHGKRVQVPDFQVHIERDLADDTGQAKVAPQEIGRVLLNLLANAFDAVGERTARSNGQYKPAVTVSTRRFADRVEIRIADNGLGIPVEIRDRIFEPFFTTKPTGTGTGLGLSLSYDIVTQGHEGTLAMASTSPAGTAFVMTLPAHP